MPAGGMIVHGGVTADRGVTRGGRATRRVGFFVNASRLASIVHGSCGARSSDATHAHA
jgi:hypothetical protein